MTHLQILTAAYDQVGIHYVVLGRPGTNYQYLFPISEHKRAEIETGDLDHLCRIRNYVEFENGSVASY